MQVPVQQQDQDNSQLVNKGNPGGTQKLNPNSQSMNCDIYAVGFLFWSITQFYLSLTFCEIYTSSSSSLNAWIFSASLILIVTAILEWNIGNQFTSVALFGMGGFFLTLHMINYLKAQGIISSTEDIMDAQANIYFVFCVFVWTLSISSFKFSKIWVGGIFLTFMFMLLGAVYYWKKGSNTELGKACGSFGCIGAIVVFYIGLAKVLNNVFGGIYAPLLGDNE